MFRLDYWSKSGDDGTTRRRAIFEGQRRHVAGIRDFGVTRSLFIECFFCKLDVEYELFEAINVC